MGKLARVFKTSVTLFARSRKASCSDLAVIPYVKSRVTPAVNLVRSSRELYYAWTSGACRRVDTLTSPTGLR